MILLRVSAPWILLVSANPSPTELSETVKTQLTKTTHS